MSLGVAGVDSDRLLKLGPRLVEAALGKQTGAEIVADLGVVGVDLYRLLQTGGGLGGLSLSAQHFTKVHTGLDVLGGDRQRLPKLIGRLVEPEPRLAAAYDEQFLEFQAELQRRGYL